MREFFAFLAIPNVATSQPDIERNADMLVTMLEARGLAARRLYARAGTPPLIFAELKVPGARRTILFYAHYDGQPASQPDWATDPWMPVLQLGPRQIDWKNAIAPIDREARIFARSTSDDKASIQALLVALDVLRASGSKPSVNVKIIYEGEEEQGSPNLPAILAANRDLLRADLILFGDGPVHQSGNMQLFYGARGASLLEMTVFGPLRPLHDGHYGNWAPNPAAMLAQLIAAMRDDRGHILIPHFYDAVHPLTDIDRAALDALPDVETGLRAELGLGRTEAAARLFDSVSLPALNVRGLLAGQVGLDAANAIPTEARASIDFRLVPDQTPEAIRTQVEAFLADSGWLVVDRPPDRQLRQSHPKIVMLDWGPGYTASKTPLDAPWSPALVHAVERAGGQRPILLPMLGGSLPMSLFAEALSAPVVGVPIANYDNNQHAENENIRLKNLEDGVGIYVSLLNIRPW